MVNLHDAMAPTLQDKKRADPPKKGTSLSIYGGIFYWQIFDNIIHSAQPSNLIGPFVPRDHPEKNDIGRSQNDIGYWPGNHRNNVKIAILDVRLTQIRQTRKDDNVSG